jgi:hypothetical protein
MLKSIAVVVGSYLLSVVLVLATDPLLSRLFPGDFVKGRVPAQLSIGLKTKPWKNLVLYGNVLIQVNNVGLRSNPAPMVGISYTFF